MFANCKTQLGTKESFKHKTEEKLGKTVGG